VTLADYFSQPCAVNAIDSGGERGSGHVYASDGISRRFQRLYRHWARAYTFHHLFLIDLVLVVVLSSPIFSLSCAIFDLAT